MHKRRAADWCRTSFVILLIGVSCPFAVRGVEWAGSYGTSLFDEGVTCIQQTADGGYIVVGDTGVYGSDDAWVLKLAGNGSVEWEKTYAGDDEERANCVQQTADGGYIVAGDTDSFDVVGRDVWVLKLYADGTIDWQKTYGGDGSDMAYSIQQTSDGGYVVAGQTTSFGAAGYDAWVLKLDAAGNVDWQKRCGWDYDDYARSVRQTRDGGYVVTGKFCLGFGSDWDLWVLRLNVDGTIVWQKRYRGADWGSETGFAVRQTADGGYVVAGYTISFGVDEEDAWLLKLDDNGTIAWQKTYGGAGSERARAIAQTADGGYVVAGETDSFGAGERDVWVLKLDANGNILWQKTYGGAGNEWARAIEQTTDSGYVVAGDTDSFGAGKADMWLLKLNTAGAIADCGIIGTSNVVPSDTSATTVEVPDKPVDTNATGDTPTFVVTNTSASSAYQCSQFGYAKGDVNGDGLIDLLDVRLCLQIADGILTPTAAQRGAADVDGDGDVDRTDAEILSEYIIGMRASLP